jgi:hypothetical protein
MEVLTWVICILLVVFALFCAAAGIAVVGFFIFIFLPTIAGLVIGIWTWWAGHDNLGMLIILVGFIGQYFWGGDSGKGNTYNPMAGKIKRYNKSGDVVGYQDKE